MLAEKRYVAPEMFTGRCISTTVNVAQVLMLFQQRVDYGHYNERCDVYALAITLAQALPAPKNDSSNELDVQRPYVFLYGAVGNTVPRFIRDRIQAKVCY